MRSPHNMKENKKEVSFMENEERDVVAEAILILKKARLAKYGYVAEGLRAVRIEEPQDTEKDNT